jgi:hypothetical protein
VYDESLELAVEGSGDVLKAVGRWTNLSAECGSGTDGSSSSLSGGLPPIEPSLASIGTRSAVPWIRSGSEGLAGNAVVLALGVGGDAVRSEPATDDALDESDEPDEPDWKL